MDALSAASRSSRRWRCATPSRPTSVGWVRIGINVDDVIVNDEDIFGHGVNLAARMQGLAAPGGIAISGAVYDQVRNKLDLDFRDRGSHRVKNIAEPVRVYGVPLEGVARRWTIRMARGLWIGSIAAGLAVLLLAVLLTIWPGGWRQWRARGADGARRPYRGASDG